MVKGISPYGEDVLGAAKISKTMQTRPSRQSINALRLMSRAVTFSYSILLFFL